MLNNRIDSIKMQSSEKKIARFNLSHDVSTSYAFGEVQPSLCLEMLGNSKAVLSKEHLVRPDPVVAPAFGRIVCKNHTRFVPMKNIWPAYDDTLAQTPFSYAGAATTPKSLPTISLGLLSSFCLIGAKYSIYDVTTGSVQWYKCPKIGSSEATAIYNDIDTWFGSSNWYALNTVKTHFGINQTGMDYISTAVLLGQSFGTLPADYPNLFIPLTPTGIINFLPFQLS